MMKIIGPIQEYADRFEFGAIAGATKAVAGIRGAGVILHGVQGCTIEASHLRSGGPSLNGGYLPLMETNLGPMEAVHGQNVPLIVNMAKELVYRRKGKDLKLLFILAGDVPSVIEDDINRAAMIIQKETGVTAIALDTAAFLGSYGRGSEQTYVAVMKKYGRSEGERQGINLVGPHLMGSNNWPMDIEEIERLLRAADVPINQVVFKGLAVEDLPKITNASTNYVLTGDDMSELEEVAEDMGIETFGQDLVLPVGYYNTEQWYLTMAEKFGDVEKAKAQIGEDMAIVKRQTHMNYTASWELTGMYGKRAAILAPAPFAAALARSLFYDFNIKPVVVGLLAETPEGLERAEKLMEVMSDHLDFEVMENPSFYAYAKKIKEEKVDFAVGMRVDEHLVVGEGIPHVTMSGPNYMNHWDLIPWPYFGIRGSLYLATELWRGVKQCIVHPNIWPVLAYRRRDEQEAEAKS